MRYFVQVGRNGMESFVRGGKSIRDVLSGVSKIGMGCFVPGCFVLHSTCGDIEDTHHFLFVLSVHRP